MTTSGCTHDTLEFNPKVNIVAEPEPFTFVAVGVRCAECHELFHWRGISSGHPNPLEPTVTADGYVLHAPISTGPGAIVGLLKATGLEGKLVDPSRLEDVAQ